MFHRPAIFRKKNDLFIYDKSLLNENRAIENEVPKSGVSIALFQDDQ